MKLKPQTKRTVECVLLVSFTGGATALHRAAYVGHMSIVQLLLNHRANVMLQDGDGKTVLHKVSSNN